MFNFIKNTLKKIYTGVTSRLASLFHKTSIDEETLNELKIILIGADTGVQTTKKIIDSLQKQYQTGALTEGSSLKQGLRSELISILEKQHEPTYNGRITILVGINGSGKTTCAGKLAYHYAQQGKKVLLVAADTFRAAAPEQLQAWSQKINVEIIQGKENQDPASVVFQGCEAFHTQQYDQLIIDTAGRLHTKVNLMNELTKIKRVVTKQLPDEKINTLLTIDSMLGQNSFEQAKLFHDSTDLSGLILTKMDGTGKGGIVFAITDALKIPIWYITFGEQAEHLKRFDKIAYVDNLLNT